jgi:hypothetical protein
VWKASAASRAGTANCGGDLLPGCVNELRADPAAETGTRHLEVLRLEEAPQPHVTRAPPASRCADLTRRTLGHADRRLAPCKGWCPQGDSNPCTRLERPVSWSSRRWGQVLR